MNQTNYTSCGFTVFGLLLQGLHKLLYKSHQECMNSPFGVHVLLIPYTFETHGTEGSGKTRRVKIRTETAMETEMETEMEMETGLALNSLRISGLLRG